MADVYGVFEGGGVRGTALVGAVAAAEKHGIKFRAVAGTSAGAIVAALIAAGHNASTIYKELRKKNFRDFEDPVRSFYGLNHIPYLRKVVHGRCLWNHLGLYKGDEFQRWVGELISLGVSDGKRRHDVPTFGEMKIPLTVIATDVYRQQARVFNSSRTADEAVAGAVRMSMSIPFYFVPVRDEVRRELLVDGGVLSNFPAGVLAQDVKADPLPIVGFRLQPDDIPQARINNAFDMAKALINTVVKASIPLQTSHLFINEIDLPTLGVATTDFDISEEKKEELYEAGYLNADSFFATEELKLPF